MDKGRDRDARADRGAEGAGAAGLRTAGQEATSIAFVERAARRRPRVPRDRRGRDARVRAGRGGARDCSRWPQREHVQVRTCGRASRRSKTSSRSAVGESDDVRVDVAFDADP